MAYYKKNERGNGSIDMSVEISSALTFFNNLDVNKFEIERRLLKTVGQGSKTAVKRTMGRVVKRRTGTLYKSIYFTMGRHRVTISTNATSGKPTSKDGRPARYGFMLAHGYTITDQNKETLTFNINGKWIRKHKVTVPAKDFVEPGVERFIASADCNQRLDKEIAKQVEYWDKRSGGKA